MITTMRSAEAIAGTLGKPSKMPGYAYGIPARACLLGSLLAKKKGTVCSNCYALKSRYIFGSVKKAQEKRLASLTHALWVEAMAFMINFRKCDFFRWHDSGDLQGMWHLVNITRVCELCPATRFWLPTRENQLISQFMETMGELPANLVVRVSGTMIDGPASKRFPNTSTVTTGEPTCPAHNQGNACGTCRKCWDGAISNVSYPNH